MERSQVTQDLRPRVPRVVNDAAVAKAGHYTIIPSDHSSTQALALRDQAVYDLITRRFLAALLPPGRDERTTIEMGRRGAIQNNGDCDSRSWLACALQPIDEDEPSKPGTEPESALPPGLKAGQSVTVFETTVDDKATKTPSRLTDASLLALLEKYGLRAHS